MVITVSHLPCGLCLEYMSPSWGVSGYHENIEKEAGRAMNPVQTGARPAFTLPDCEMSEQMSAGLRRWRGESKIITVRRQFPGTIAFY